MTSKLKTVGLVLLSGLTLALFFQNCDQTQMAAVSSKNGSQNGNGNTKGDGNTEGPGARLDQVTKITVGGLDDQDQDEAIDPLYSADLLTGVVTYRTGRICDMSEQLLRSYTDFFQSAESCSTSIPAGAVSCMAYTLPYAKLYQPSGVVSVLPTKMICAQNGFKLCGDKNAVLEKMLSDLGQQKSVGLNCN